MATKKATKLPFAYLESIGQRSDIAIVEGAALDELEGPGHRRRSAAPGIQVRRTFRAAAQAWSITGFLRGGSGRHKTAVFELWRSSGANWPAIDSGCLYASEEPPIIAGIPCQHRAVTN
jgi:hypothetical protein